MDHAVGTQILHEGGAAGHFGGNVDAWNAPVHDFELTGILQRRVRRRLDVQQLRRNQLAIAEAAAVGSEDCGVLRLHLIGRHPARVAASAMRSCRTCAAAFMMAVPESCIEWLPAV